jgi:hypothetical protein
VFELSQGRLHPQAIQAAQRRQAEALDEATPELALAHVHVLGQLFGVVVRRVLRSPSARLVNAEGA